MSPNRAVHLTGRFLGSLRPGGPAPGEERWARSHLLAGEVAVWARMSGADRRHAAGVARRVERSLGPAAGRPVLAAALLHDSGKVESGLGTFARVAATLAGMAVGRARAEGWAGRSGPLGRAGRYLAHPELGARLLAAAGSDPLTVAWARDHHLPADRWSVPLPVATALKDADDD